MGRSINRNRNVSSRWRDRSRSRKRCKINDNVVVDIDYGDLERFVDKKIKEEDSEKHCASNSRKCAKKVLGEKMSMLTSMFNDFRQTSRGATKHYSSNGPLMVNMRQNTEIVRVKRRKRHDTKRDQELKLERESRWRPSKEYQEKLDNLKEIYG